MGARNLISIYVTDPRYETRAQAVTHTDIICGGVVGLHGLKRNGNEYGRHKIQTIRKIKMCKDTQVINLYYTSPNQRIVCFHNDSLDLIKTSKQGDNDCDYDCVIHKIDSAAMRDLKGNEYKMYSYLRKNKDGIVLALSPEDVYNYTGLSDKAYRSAVKGLIEKGYLQQRGKPRNIYDFYISPHSANNAPLPSVSSTQKTAVSTADNGSIDAPEKGGEIIQDSIINSIENNTVNSIENNRHIKGLEDKAARLVGKFGITTIEQARNVVEQAQNTKNSKATDDDELPF